MEIAVFDGNEDAYWGILSTENYFNVKGIIEKMKVTKAVAAMSGLALRWWLWWYQQHPQVNWETFTVALLWHFKPEYKDALSFLEEGGADENEAEGLRSYVDLPTTAQDLVSAKIPFSYNSTILFLDPMVNDDTVTMKSQSTGSATIEDDDDAATHVEEVPIIHTKPFDPGTITPPPLVLPSKKPPDKLSVSFPPPKPPDPSLTTMPLPSYPQLSQPLTEEMMETKKTEPLLLLATENVDAQTKKMMARDERVPTPESGMGTPPESEAALEEGGSPYNLGEVKLHMVEASI